MNISEEGIGLIKRFEGCRLESYQDSVGVWTIGYGSTRGVGPGQVITQDEADRRFLVDKETVEKCIANSVSAELTQGQYDALCSFVFNLGCRALGNSTLLRKLNDGDEEGAAQEFMRWNHAGGKVLKGLTDRRQAEHDLFIA
jgi:GH24 family phage-related lysozyme (muramidase)